MRLAIAILMSLAIASVGLLMLRGLRRPPPSTVLPEPEPQPADVRVTFWCENCGTEVLLLRRGSEAPPKHCGEPMVRREEIPRA